MQDDDARDNYHRLMSDHRVKSAVAKAVEAEREACGKARAESFTKHLAKWVAREVKLRAEVQRLEGLALLKDQRIAVLASGETDPQAIHDINDREAAFRAEFKDEVAVLRAEMEAARAALEQVDDMDYCSDEFACTFEDGCSKDDERENRPCVPCETRRLIAVWRDLTQA